MAKSSSKKRSTSSEPAVKAHVDNNSSVSVRQIQNGFVVSESGYTGKGRNQQWYNKEWFSKTNPIKLSGGTTMNTGRPSGGMKFGGSKK